MFTRKYNKLTFLNSINLMGFNGVSFGHTVDHGDVFNFLDLLFSNINVKHGSDGKNVTVELYPYPDVLIDRLHQDKLVVNAEWEDGCDDWMEIQDIQELLNENEYIIEYKGSRYNVCDGHCCSYGIMLAATDQWDFPDKVFAPEEIQKFCDMLRYLKEANRISSDSIHMTRNCCS